MSLSAKRPILYSFRRCPYAMRARMALHMAGINVEHREVALRNKPAEMLAASEKGTVPVLILPDGHALDESLDIMTYALPAQSWDVGLVAANDGAFKHHLDQYKYKSRYDDTAKRGDVDLTHRAAAVDILRAYEARLASQAYLSGDALSLTDIAIFPFVRQFAATQADWWATQEDVPKTRAWLANCLASELFTSVMQRHPLWVSPSGDVTISP